MKKNRTFFILTPLLLWYLLVGIEITSLFFQFPKPMYFRAWEHVLNEGKDGYYVPFKPLVSFSGKLTGDLLTAMNFLPKTGDIYDQAFQVDEYGYRNETGILNQPISAVLLGTSFLGGAHETQDKLVNELLLHTYEIRTYNYATFPLQHFWEDERFIKSPPKYAIIIGSEGEILQNSWIEVLQDTTVTHPVPAWKNYNEWNSLNNQFAFDYINVSKYAKRFSITKYYSQKISKELLNTFLTREQIAYEFVKNGQYDPENKMIFFDVSAYDPRFNTTTQKAVEATVQTLVKTKKILAKRNIKLLIVVMPGKDHLYAKKYKRLTPEKSALYVLQQQFEENQIEYIDMLSISSKIKKSTGQLLYYRDDSHWTTLVNEIIAKKIAEKLTDNELNREN